MKKIMVILTLCIMAAAGFAGVSEAQFNQIQPGMSFEEVQDIINEWGYSVKMGYKTYYFFKNQEEGFSSIVYYEQRVIEKIHSCPSWTSGQEVKNILEMFPFGRGILKKFPDLADFSVRLMGLILSIQTPEELYAFLYLYSRQWDPRFANKIDQRNRKFVAEFIENLKESAQESPTVSQTKINEWMQEYSDQDQRKFLVTNELLAQFGLFYPHIRNILFAYKVVKGKQLTILNYLEVYTMVVQSVFHEKIPVEGEKKSMNYFLHLYYNDTDTFQMSKLNEKQKRKNFSLFADVLQNKLGE